MSDNHLKKEFKHSDVQRVRNIVNKDFTAKTKAQVGYQKAHKSHKEGDKWEESGKTWTIKNGLKQNVTKLDAAKKAMRIPLACPKCSSNMNYHLHKKMYKIHGFCFDCTVDYEATLRKAGLYEAYEKKMMSGAIDSFVKDLNAWVNEFVTEDLSKSFVTESGVIEDWNGNKTSQKEEVINTLKEFTNIISKHQD